MTAPLLDNHRHLTELFLMEPDIEATYRQNRAKNFPNWLQQTHPEALTNINPDTTPATYLQHLYPQLWNRGPRGEHLDNQLRTLHHILDTNADPPKFNKLTDSIHNNAITNLTKTLNNRAANQELYNIAYTQGLPLPGAAIYHGIDYNTSQPNDQPGNPLLNQLRYHIAWDNNPANANAFENFLYNFALLSVHSNTFHTLTDDRVHNALTDYATFCATWDIPQ